MRQEVAANQESIQARRVRQDAELLDLDLHDNDVNLNDEAAGSPATQRAALAADVRILRSLTGANYNIGPPQINEESGSNSYKSEDEELDEDQDDLISSQRDEAD